MKLFAVFVIALFFGNGIVAADERKWDIIGYGGPGGLFDTTAKILAPHAGGDVVLFQTCVEAANYARKTDKPSLVLMDLDEHTRFLLKGDDECTFFKEGDLPFVNMVGEGFLNAYSVKGSGNNVEKLKSGEVFVGSYEGLIMFKGAKALFEAINPDIKVLPYRNAGAIIAAIEADEIQYGWTSRPKAKYDVVITNNPEGRGDGSVPTVNLTDSPLATSAYIFYVAGANVDPEEASAVIQDILQNDEAYADMFRSAGYSITNGMKTREEQEALLLELSEAYVK